MATVAGFTPHHPPVVILSPEPQGPPHWAAYSTARSDLSLQGQSVRDLLEHRGEAYLEHLLRGRDLDTHLAERAALLNADEPQLLRSWALFATQTSANRDHAGSLDTTQWVPTRLVAATRLTTWGEFNGHRQSMLKHIAQGLLDAQDLQAFTATLFTDPINLMHTPAWAGPLYRVGLNGNHRVHLARLLDLPWLATTVSHTKTPPAWKSSSMASVESDVVTNHWSEQRARIRHALIEGLIRRGIVEGEFVDDGHSDDNPSLLRRTLRCTRLPAPWLVRAPELAVAANAFYEKLYPGALAMLGIPTQVGIDASAWQAWLADTR